MKQVILLKDPAHFYQFALRLRNPPTPKPSLRSRFQSYQNRFLANPLKHGLILYLGTLLILTPIYQFLLK